MLAAFPASCFHLPATPRLRASCAMHRGCRCPTRRTFTPALQACVHSMLAAFPASCLHLPATPPLGASATPHGCSRSGFRSSQSNRLTSRGSGEVDASRRILASKWRLYLPPAASSRTARVSAQLSPRTCGEYLKHQVNHACYSLPPATGAAEVSSPRARIRPRAPQASADPHHLGY